MPKFKPNCAMMDALLWEKSANNAAPLNNRWKFLFGPRFEKGKGYSQIQTNFPFNQRIGSV
jgi:hypothetical protein